GGEHSFHPGFIETGAVCKRASAGAVKQLAVTALGARPGAFGAHGKQPGAGAGRSGDGLGVAAETVVLGVVDQAGANSVEIDVGGHGLQRAATRFDEHALEAFGPQGSKAAVGLVKPTGET